MTLRVLHVYSGNLYGGVETLLSTLARYRSACPDMESHFALSFEGRLSGELRKAAAPVTVLGEVRISRPHTVLRARRALRKLLTAQKFDVAVCHSTWPQAVFGPVLRRAGVPFAFYMHNWTEGRDWLERIAKRVVPNLVIVNSRYTAQSAPNMYRGVPVEVFYSPHIDSGAVSGTRRGDIRAPLDSPGDAVVIIQVSRLEPWKGHRLHLEALGQLRHVPGWICWQVGGAQRPHELEHLAAMRLLAEKMGIASRVRFLGQRADVPALLSAADIHCQPNLAPESFGSTFIEAMFAGLPVVTTALGGPNEIVDESCGVRVPPGDARALAEALSGLIQDPARRERLGAAARRRATALCDLATQMAAFRDLLANLTVRERQPGALGTGAAAHPSA